MGNLKSGGQILVETLVHLGARQGFGVPGESYLAVLDAFYDQQHDFKFTLTRNEGGAAFMAEAWAKLTGEVGLCFVTRGPGATNAAIGVHSAMQASTPMILFVGQVGTDHQGREAFQELDYRQVFGPIAKWATEITRADRVAEVVQHAWVKAISGRPGPVVVALPEDMLRDMASVPTLRPMTAPVAPGVDPSAAQTLRDRLARAQRPILLVGGGGWTADDIAALDKTVGATGLPVITAFRNHDLFDNTNPLFLGEAGVGMTANVHAALEQADVIVALNVRFGEMTTDVYTLFGPDRGDQWIAHFHKSGDEFGKVVQADMCAVAAPGAVLAALSNTPASGYDHSWITAARAAYDRGQIAPDQSGPVDMGVVTQHVQSCLTQDAIVTNGAGNFAIWPNKFLRFGPGQRLLAPQSGAMGYGLPAAIAAKIECPDRQVICFAGDGDFQMNGQELGTAMEAGVGPVVLIVNNGTYGTIRMHQERAYPGRVSGTNLRNPDFAMLAQSYGLHGETVAQTSDFADAFARALSSPTGAVLDLRVATDAITPRQTIQQIREQSKG